MRVAPQFFRNMFQNQLVTQLQTISPHLARSLQYKDIKYKKATREFGRVHGSTKVARDRYG
jgi:hypothetical protein